MGELKFPKLVCYRPSLTPVREPVEGAKAMVRWHAVCTIAGIEDGFGVSALPRGELHKQLAEVEKCLVAASKDGALPAHTSVKMERDTLMVSVPTELLTFKDELAHIMRHAKGGIPSGMAIPFDKQAKVAEIAGVQAPDIAPPGGKSVATGR